MTRLEDLSNIALLYCFRSAPENINLYYNIKSDIPQLFEDNGKYLKELMPKAIDQINFDEKKFYASYEQVILFFLF